MIEQCYDCVFANEYYTENGYSPLTAMKKGLISREEYIGFLKGNVIKYIVAKERCKEYQSKLI